MNNRRRSGFTGAVVVSLLGCFCSSVSAETLEQKMDRLELLVQTQQQQLEAQNRRLAEQAQLLRNQGAQLETLSGTSEEVADAAQAPPSDVSSRRCRGARRWASWAGAAASWA